MTARRTRLATELRYFRCALRDLLDMDPIPGDDWPHRRKPGTLAEVPFPGQIGGTERNGRRYGVKY